jgi:hypothetical protein
VICSDGPPLTFVGAPCVSERHQSALVAKATVTKGRGPTAAAARRRSSSLRQRGGVSFKQAVE